MAETETRPASKPFWRSPRGQVTLAALLWIASGIGAAAANVYLEQRPVENDVQRIILAYGLYAPATLLALFGLVMSIIGAVRWALYGKNGVGLDLGGSEQQEIDLLRSINERLLLSETAKRIAYRHEDISLLRSTIQADIEKKDFDAALVLVSELSQTYGYREEAEHYRDEILSARTAEQEAKVAAAIARLDEVLARHEFDRAAREADKIQRMFPESPRVKKLDDRVRRAQEQYKHDLEREFLEAAQRDDVSRAIELLKELDRYLTEQEAEPFRETARGVIGKQRDNLGVQFKMAVQDKEWTRAVQVGEQLIRDFPNTRMADEVRGMLDVLRARAAEQRAAAG